MKQKDVKIGGEYLTKVSGARVKVRVKHEITAAGRAGKMAYRLVRVDTGAELPKARTASALHPIPEPKAVRTVATLDGCCSYGPSKPEDSDFFDRPFTLGD